MNARLLDAVSESRRAGLEALRDTLAASIEQADPEKRAPLVRELRMVMAELESLAEPRGSTVDDLTARRAARRSAASQG